MRVSDTSKVKVDIDIRKMLMYKRRVCLFITTFPCIKCLEKNKSLELFRVD